MKNKFLIIVLIILVSLSFGLKNYQRSKSTESKEVVVMINKDGFSPSEIQINKGDTVVFKSSIGKPFWPASDPHPTHTILSEFDPRQPIESNSSWSFTFTKAGKWTFHNHLLPSERGTITVLEKDGSLGVNQISCEAKPNQLSCWSELIDKTLAQQGLDSALKQVETLYRTEPTFASDCHGFVHKLGEATYTLYSQGKNVPVSVSSSFCGYGFYHGFMEELFLHTGDMVQAGNFCNMIYEKQNIVSGDACYHGLGHGAEALAVSDPSVWGDPKKMFSKSLSICDNTSDGNNIKFSRCSSGVFMEAATYFSEGTYKLSFNKDNPFSICEGVEDRVKMNCYTQLYPVLKTLSNNNLLRASKFVEQIKEDSYAIEAMETLSGSIVNVVSKDHNNDILTCRSIEERLRIPCIKGLAVGFLLNGIPGQQYAQTSDFCLNSGLKEDEKVACFDVTLRQLNDSYPKSQMLQYCNMTEEKYKNNLCK